MIHLRHWRSLHDDFRSIYQALKAWGQWRARQYSPPPPRPVGRAFTPPDYAVFLKTCSLCHGLKQVGAERCPACKGRGQFSTKYPVIDPALIPGPSVMRVVGDQPQVFLEIDAAVNSFDLTAKAVVLARYVYAPKKRNDRRLWACNRTLMGNGGQLIASPAFAQMLKDCQTRLANICGLPI